MSTTATNKARASRHRVQPWRRRRCHGDFAAGFVVGHMPGQPVMDRCAFEQFVAGFGEGFPGYL